MFLKAQPIWVRGREREMNVSAEFRANVTLPGPGQLFLAGTAFYRVSVNGYFLAFGPARAAEGYVRQDVLALPAGECDIRIEASGYYCRSLSTVLQPSFLTAEVRCEQEVLAWTGGNFQVFTPGTRVQKVERYSMQRHFSEIWDYRREDRSPAQWAVQETACTVLPRVVPYPRYEDLSLRRAMCRGSLTFDETLPYKPRRYSWTEAGWGEFPAQSTWNRPHWQIPLPPQIREPARQ